MARIESIYANVVRAGVLRQHEVVPEFCATPVSRLFRKKIDVAWLASRAAPHFCGSLRHWRIVAAFEIEGYDVPIERIQMHAVQFRQLKQESGEHFPCLIPLYSRAHHRDDPNWGTEDPVRFIRERAEAAEEIDPDVRVCDGRSFEWISLL